MDLVCKNVCETTFFIGSDTEDLSSYSASAVFVILAFSALIAFSALTLLVAQQEGHPACKKTEWWGVGVVICLETCILPS